MYFINFKKQKYKYNNLICDTNFNKINNNSKFKLINRNNKINTL